MWRKSKKFHLLHDTMIHHFICQLEALSSFKTKYKSDLEKNTQSFLINRSRQRSRLELGRAQPVIPPNLYSVV